MTMLCCSSPCPTSQHLPPAESLCSQDTDISSPGQWRPTTIRARDSARSSPSHTTHRSAGHLHHMLQGKAWEKAASKNPKSHINARNLQKKFPCPTWMLARFQLCLAVAAAVFATRHLHIQVRTQSFSRLSPLWPPRSRMGRWQLGRCGGAVSYPTKTQADARTVPGWAAEPCLRGQVPQSYVQPQLGHHQEGHSGTVLP